MLHQRGDEGVKRAAATGGKVAWRAGCIAVPIAPAFMIAMGSGNPAGDVGVDDRTWLVLGNQVEPRSKFVQSYVPAAVLRSDQPISSSTSAVPGCEVVVIHEPFVPQSLRGKH